MKPKTKLTFYSINKRPRIEKFPFPHVDLTHRRRPVIWYSRKEVETKLPNSVYNPNSLSHPKAYVNYRYIACFQPEDIIDKLPGRTGWACWVYLFDRGYLWAEDQSNLYSIQWLCHYLLFNLRGTPPLSEVVSKYTLTICFILKSYPKTLVVTNPIRFERNIQKTLILTRIRRRYTKLLFGIQNPALVHSIILYLGNDYGPPKKKFSLKYLAYQQKTYLGTRFVSHTSRVERQKKIDTEEVISILKAKVKKTITFKPMSLHKVNSIPIQTILYFLLFYLFVSVVNFSNQFI